MLHRTRFVHRFPALALAALVGLVGYQTVAHRPAQPSAPTHVATIDLERVFNALAQKKAADDEIQRLQSTMTSELKQQADRIRRMEADLSDHLPGSAKYRELEGKLLMAVGEYQAQQEFSNAKFSVERGRQTNRVYQSIRVAACTLAEQHRIDLILVDDSVVEMTEGDVDSITRQISARRVVYANPTLDITEELISHMNKEFQARTSAPQP